MMDHNIMVIFSLEEPKKKIHTKENLQHHNIQLCKICTNNNLAIIYQISILCNMIPEHIITNPDLDKHNLKIQ